MSQTAPHIGPVLILDDISDTEMHLSALFITEDAPPPDIKTDRQTFQADLLLSSGEMRAWRTRFTRPVDAPSSYTCAGEHYGIAGALKEDLRIAYVSCNGEEEGDLEREGSERNAMWARLCDQHEAAPFHLLLHGGDQVYADEATHGHPLSDGWPDVLPRDPTREDLADLEDHLRARFFERYRALYSAPEFAWIAARVPSLMQWDDHDICDGWGSLKRSQTYSPVGQKIFEIAREAFLVFQNAATDNDLPGRFADPEGIHLGWQVSHGDLRLIAPDLRSERTRRQVMGNPGWAMMEAAADADFPGRTLLLSSVPLLGPRLSILEALMVAVPKMQKYEDDLRDQWQSRAHRDEWRRMLRLTKRLAAPDTAAISAISGEIHLATRATMSLGAGKVLHQLVASGIAHRPPPQAWARLLGAISWLGEDPLPESPIKIHPLPGQRGRYTAQRNSLVLERQAGAWSARWDLEDSGMTPALHL